MLAISAMSASDSDALGAVDHVAEVPGVDEEDLTRPVDRAVLTRPTCPWRRTTDIPGSRWTAEQLGGQGDHAGHQVGLDHLGADVAFSAGVRRTSSRWP